MNIHTALERAQQLKPTQKAAASDLYGDIDYELAFGDVDQETYEQAEDALEAARRVLDRHRAEATS